HHLGLERVDGQRCAAIAQAFQHGQQAVDFFLQAHRGRARTRGFGADVDNVGAFGGKLQAVRNGGVGFEMARSVGKRIGGDVEDPHDHGALERKLEAPAEQLGAHGCITATCCYTGVAAVLPLPPPTAGAPAGGVGESGVSKFLGGRGARPSMMSSIWSESMVSHSSSAAAMASILSRLPSMMLRATVYCSSM